MADESLVERVGPFWSARRTAEALGVGMDVLDVLRASGRVLGCRGGDGTWAYPLSQFVTDDGQTRVRDQLVPILQALRRLDGWGVATLLLEPADELGGASPLDWARAGGAVEPVVGLAQALATQTSPLHAPPSATEARVRNTRSWLDSLDARFEMLDAIQMGQRLGLGGPGDVLHRARVGELLSVGSADHSMLFPAFQLDADGTVRPALAEALSVASAAGRSPEFLMLWLTEPHTFLGSAVPLDLLRGADSQRVPEQLKADLEPAW